MMAGGTAPLQADFDLFVSYKSEDANLVRSVVESLLRHGLRVWFNEYAVSLDKWDEEFQTEIDRGIDTSRWALAFTNDRWVDSPYCRLEIDRILDRQQRDGAAARLLEVALPPQAGPHEYAPQLRQAPRLELDGEPGHGWVATVVQFVAHHTDLRVEAASTAQDEPIQLGERWPLRCGVGLATGPLRPYGRRDVQSTGSGVGYQFKGRIEGCEVGLLVVVNPFATALRELSVAERDSGDDRLIYDGYRRFAHRWLHDQGYEHIGLHLHFWEGHSQLALTYRVPAGSHGMGSSDAIAERRYVVFVKTPDGADAGEINLAFGLYSTARSNSDLNQAVWAAAPILDAIVSSLVYLPDPARSREAFIALAYKLPQPVIACWLVWFAQQSAAPPWLVTLLTAGGAAALLDFLLGWLHPSYRREQVRQFISHGQRRMVLFLLAIEAAMAGLALQLGVAVVPVAAVLRVGEPAFWMAYAASCQVLGVLHVLAEQAHRHGGYRSVRRYAAGEPVIDVDDGALNAISPLLSPLLTHLRHGDRADALELLGVALGGVFLGAAIVLGGHTAIGIAVGAITSLSAVGRAMQRRVEVPRAARDALAGFEAVPDADHAVAVAASFLAETAGKRTFGDTQDSVLRRAPRDGWLSWAVQWALKACQLSPHEPGVLRLLGRALTDAAQWMSSSRIDAEQRQLLCAAGLAVFGRLEAHLPEAGADADVAAEIAWLRERLAADQDHRPSGPVRRA